MKNTRSLLSLLAGLLLVAVLAGCATTAKGPVPKLDDATALDLIWSYEMNLIQAVKNADPYPYVTDLEKQWLDDYLAKKKAGEKVAVGWVTGGAVLKVEKVTSKEATVKLQFEGTGGLSTVTFKLVPVGGEWKIANHTTPDGKWWAPSKQ